jgi:DNA polymerase II small subunit/DNA polymerase delta subunit B
VGVLSIQDLHFGKEDNADVKTAFEKAIQELMLRSYYSHKLEKIVYVIGGDLLNMDTFGGLTTKGTPVDSDQRAQDAYDTAFESMFWSVNFIKQFCDTLEVVYLPGNHDRLSSYHLVHALSKFRKKSYYLR